MSGLTAIIRTDGAEDYEQAILASLNPLGDFASKVWRSKSKLMATSYPPEAPATPKRFYPHRLVPTRVFEEDFRRIDESKNRGLSSMGGGRGHPGLAKCATHSI